VPRRRSRVAQLSTLGRTARMDKQPVTPRSHKEMIREYPIDGRVPGWYFRVREVSNGCYVVEGSDVYGRTISRQTTADPDAVLKGSVPHNRTLEMKGRRRD
jgi:hypothetical protein